MNYILLAAGKGTRLHPYTKSTAKPMIMLSKNETVLQRTVRCIKENDSSANICIVGGFKFREVLNSITGCDVIFNPYYDVTNSIASLWFARDYLNEAVSIINADTVYSYSLWKTIINATYDAVVCVDSSIKKNGDYNVQVYNNKIVIMSKQLADYYGEYAGITMLNRANAKLLNLEICSMIEDGFYNEWYENALVQLILNDRLELGYFDIYNYEWAEIDTVNDLFLARKIVMSEV